MSASFGRRGFGEALPLPLIALLMFALPVTTLAQQSSFEVVTGLAESPPDPIGPVVANVLNLGPGK